MDGPAKKVPKPSKCPTKPSAFDDPKTNPNTILKYPVFTAIISHNL